MLELIFLLLLELCHIQALVDDFWDGANFRAEFVFYPVQREAVVICDEVEGNTEVAKATRSADAVKVGLCHLGEVKVDYNVDSLDIDTTSEQICTH